jgi:hypothetical protein
MKTVLTNKSISLYIYNTTPLSTLSFTLTSISNFDTSIYNERDGTFVRFPLLISTLQTCDRPEHPVQYKFQPSFQKAELKYGCLRSLIL